MKNKSPSRPDSSIPTLRGDGHGESHACFFRGTTSKRARWTAFVTVAFALADRVPCQLYSTMVSSANVSVRNAASVCNFSVSQMFLM